MAIDTAEHARAVLRLVDLLDDNDDIQDVYANFDIPAEILEALDGGGAAGVTDLRGDHR